MKVWLKIKNFFSSHWPSKRRIIQLYAALLYNANIKGFIKGEIFHGASKGICVPGFNCYSCPGAIGACPLGSLQNALASANKKLPYYIVGILLLYGIILGRTICGFLCPIGLIQDLLYKIKTFKIRKNHITRALSYLKYLLLAIMVIIIPTMYSFQNVVVPAFCKYICPVGTFEGAILLLSNPRNYDLLSGLGPIFTWKFSLLIIFVIFSIFIYRFFCRFICPLGAIYSLFNRISFIGVKVDDSKCIACGKCIQVCKVDIKKVGDHECIQCGECISSCPTNAIVYKGPRVLLKNTAPEVSKELEQKPTKKKHVALKAVTYSISTLVLVGAITYSFLGDSKQNELTTNQEFVVQTFENEKITIENLKDKASILYFFDQVSYQEEIHKMSETFERYDTNLLAICVENIVTDVSSWKEIYPTIQFVKDDEKKSAAHAFFEKVTYPLAVVLDSNGIVYNTYQNEFTWEQVLNDSMNFLNGKVIIGNHVGDICPNQELSLYFKENETFSISKCRGKPTILNFWGTTCGPCVAELPFFNSLAKKYQNEIQVVAIHNKFVVTDVEAFIQYDLIENDEFQGENYLLWAQDDLTNSYFELLGGGDSFPWTFFIDENGIIRKIQPNSITYEMLENGIKELLNK